MTPPPYNRASLTSHQVGNKTVLDFLVAETARNIDWTTVESFGSEWSRFHEFPDEDIAQLGGDYFDILPIEVLTPEATVLDVGCGSGRWSKFLAPKVGWIDAIDPSEAALVAARTTQEQSNIRVSRASADAIPFADNQFDLVMSLGVLHHIPDTGRALKDCVQKVKPGGRFLVYLYYDLDNRGMIFRVIFQFVSMLRSLVSRLSSPLKRTVCDGLAVILYLPWIMLARILAAFSWTESYVPKIPLSYYRDKSWYIVRNDSLDRFGTPLEQRFSRRDIQRMMEEAGLVDIRFSEREPYWHAIGTRIEN